MKSWIFRSDGTVTIFCSLIMMFLTLFLMVLVDYARILLFQRTTESALRLSAQSVLSAYDQQLYTNYGLFARGGSDADQLFHRAMELNLLNSYNVFSLHQGSDFASPKLEDFNIVAREYLGQHIVFERQLLEEMKYKAPIDFTLELIEQWLPLQGAVEEVDIMLRILDELESLFDEREQKLDLSLKLQRDLGALLSSSSFPRAINISASSTLDKYNQYLSWLTYREEIAKEIKELLQIRTELIETYEHVHEHQSEEENSEEETSEELSKLLEAYDQQIEMLEDRLDDYDAQISSYITTAGQVVNHISDESSSLLNQSEQLKNQIDELLLAAKALDNTIKIKYEIYLKQSTEQSHRNTEMEQELGKLDFDESMIRGEHFYLEYLSDISIQQQALEALLKDGQSLGSLIHSLVNRPSIHSHNQSDFLEAKQLMNSLSSAIEQYRKDYDIPALLLGKWEREMQASNEVRTQMAQYESEFQEAVSAFDAISDLLQVDWEATNTDYDILKDRYHGNYSFNAEEVSDFEDDQVMSGSGKKQAAKAMSMMSSILRSMSKAAAMARDHVYINEYAMNRFSSFPIESITAGGGHSAEWLDISQQEVEYIIYGIHEPLANVIMATGEIFAVRLAIRTIEGFIANRGLSHPLLILGAAIVHGVRLAMTDMNELLQEGTTELSRYAAMKIDYKNYLRLFMLLHIGGKAKKLSRMIALIEHNLDLRLLDVPTSISAQVELSMQLWALPGVAAMIGALGPGDSEVNGNEYKKTESVTASY